MAKFDVLRPHQGDKWYAEGDERTADEREVAHLVARGVLRKREPEVKNKARSVPKNKARGK